MFKRFISLYYGSIGFSEALVLVYGLISAIWETDEQKRRKISERINKYFPNTRVYSYSSARSSIAACLGAWGIGPGDKVLISAFTCLAVPTGIIAVRAKPIYADIKPLSLNNGEDQLINLIDDSVKAIIVQHTMGFGLSFSKLKEIASKKGILIIEDCALSWGAAQSGVLLGSKADAVIFSMELSKTISTGWGGVLLSRNDKLSIRLNEHYEMLGKPGFKRVIKETFQTAISGICQKPEIHWIGKYIIYLFFKFKIFKYSTPGNEIKGSPSSDFILKLAGPQLMLLAFQWKKMSSLQFQYPNNISYITNSLAGLENIKISDYDDLQHAVSPRICFYTEDRQLFTDWFLENGVEVGYWFDGPLSPLPESEKFNFDPELFPNAKEVASHVVNLPFHCRLTHNDLRKIASLIRNYLLKYPEKKLIWLGT
jgi:dTDP-4-amino-4,6-dideoxygalactose transaminase